MYDYESQDWTHGVKGHVASDLCPICITDASSGQALEKIQVNVAANVGFSNFLLDLRCESEVRLH